VVVVQAKCFGQRAQSPLHEGVSDFYLKEDTGQEVLKLNSLNEGIDNGQGANRFGIQLEILCIFFHAPLPRKA